MSRTRRRKPRVRDVHHVRLYDWLLKSEAYKALSPGARAALVEFYALHFGHNNGDIHMSVRQLAKRLGVTGNTSRRYIAELIDKGFIQPNVLGAFTRKTKQATTWICTEFTVGDSLKPTKDFLKWRPPDVAAKIQFTVSKFAHHGIKNSVRNADLSAPKGP